MFDDLIQYEPNLSDCLTDVYKIQRELNVLTDEQLISFLEELEDKRKVPLPNNIKEIVVDYYCDKFDTEKRKILNGYYILNKIDLILSDDGEIYIIMAI